MLEELRLQLNRDALLGLFELELHYAWYPPGAGYARHVDQPHGREQRRVSLVLYLNAHWAPSDGGELRESSPTIGRYRDIEPVAGRLVLFLTEGREHAVLPTRRDRLSLTRLVSRPRSARVWAPMLRQVRAAGAAGAPANVAAASAEAARRACDCEILRWHECCFVGSCIIATDARRGARIGRGRSTFI